MSSSLERVPAGPQAPQTPPAREPGRGGRGSTGRGRFWVGFVIGFALLTMASCSGLAYTLGFGRISLAELRGDNVAWTPPTLIPTTEAPPAAEGQIGVEAEGRFAAGNRLRNITSSRVNVRATPGHLGKDEGDILAQIAPGEQVEMLGETAQANNLIWHKVLFQGVEGWVAESTASGVQILGE